MALPLNPAVMRDTALALLLLVAVIAGAQAQSWRRAVGAAGAAASDIASKQSDAEAQLDQARKMAEIELELQRKLIDLRAARVQKDATAASVVVDAEEEKLNREFPSWAKVVTSPLFGSWLKTIRADDARACRDTNYADVLLLCINNFLETRFASR